MSKSSHTPYTAPFSPGKPLARKVTLLDLAACRTAGIKLPMLTCYDYSWARVFEASGIPTLLVGDSASNVILGRGTTLPMTLGFMEKITAAVRLGSPNCFLLADMPFGSYQASVRDGVNSVIRMVKRTGCDMVKLELGRRGAPLVERLADAGVAVMAHLGLRPQSIQMMGTYRYQGRSSAEVTEIVRQATEYQAAGAKAILLEAVPASVSARVKREIDIPLIGCGAGSPCDGYVVVSHDALGFSASVPRFVPRLTSVRDALAAAAAQYAKLIATGGYPTPEMEYGRSPVKRSK